MRLMRVTAAGFGLALTLTGCSPLSDGEAAPSASPSASSTGDASSSTPTLPSAAPDDMEQNVIGTVVRFTAGSESVDMTIGVDSPATRDFLSLLPLTLTLEEFNGREKIAELPRELNYEGSPGSDPEDGDLIYYIPWGNIGFYYNTAGIGYSDQTLHLGTYHATPEELSRLEGTETSVEIVH